MRKEFSSLKKDCPPIPKPTCPSIDNAQRYLEILRAQNEALRDAGKYWKEKSEELLEELCNSNRYIERLEKDE
tara:strand:+ start:6633 stop:6851 length:219 start_codon:yes stop_codon:yes gene_type:complete